MEISGAHDRCKFHDVSRADGAKSFKRDGQFDEVGIAFISPDFELRRPIELLQVNSSDAGEVAIQVENALPRVEAGAKPSEVAILPISKLIPEQTTNGRSEIREGNIFQEIEAIHSLP